MARLPIRFRQLLELQEGTLCRHQEEMAKDHDLIDIPADMRE